MTRTIRLAVHYTAVVCFAVVCFIAATPALAQEPPPATPDGVVLEGDRDAIGLPVVSVEVVGNRLVSDTQVLNTTRTRVGDPFDPRMVTEDYQRIYNQRRFRRVDARYEIVDRPGGRGVAVVFEVEELPPVDTVEFNGNRKFASTTLRDLLDIEVGFTAGQRGDPVLLAFAVDAIERLYKSQNHALVQVNVVRDEATGAVVFDIVEGPVVRIRNIDFLGAASFSERELKRQISTKVWAWLSLLGYDGEFDEAQLDEDVASLVRFYRDMGYFDARVGRRVVWSPDLTQVQIEFLVDEGARYEIGEIRFQGHSAVDEAALRAAIEAARVTEGKPYDAQLLRQAISEIVKTYSPLGYIYSIAPPGITPDPEFLDINPQPSFRMEEGIVDITFVISEGKPFRVGDIQIRGNDKTQDKVILREFDLAPGQLYDSDAVSRATRRLEGSRYYTSVRVTPVRSPDNGEDERDLLIEVVEQSTALLTFGGSLNSNGGVAGRIAYEQRNFDLFDFPRSPGDLFGESFQGAGQSLRISLEPGTVRTNASIDFFEPHLFDQNLGFGTEAYYRTIRRREYQDTRAGGVIRFVPRIGRNISTSIGIRGEDVRIFDIDDVGTGVRAPEIEAAEGHTTLTSVQFRVGYTRLDHPLTPTSGITADAGWETFGVLGGPSFQRINAGASAFVPLYRDERDRATVFELRGDTGAIYNDAPFFERFYAGGFGSVRGFRFRGISPRDGLDEDAVGGDFMITGSASLGFPIYDRTLRGVVFTDFGSVDDDYEFDTIRVSAGFGIRLTFDALGGIPFAFDLAWPLNDSEEDDLQVFSFSLGILQ